MDLRAEILDFLTRTGELVASRTAAGVQQTLDVPSAGAVVEFGLPNVKGVAAWAIVILNHDTAPSGTDTRLYFSINDARGKQRTLDAFAAGQGLYLVPGRTFEDLYEEDKANGQPLLIALRGVQVAAGPAYSAAAVRATIAAVALVRARRD